MPYIDPDEDNVVEEQTIETRDDAIEQLTVAVKRLISKFDKPLLNGSTYPTKIKKLDRSQFLETIEARLFTILKISFFGLILLAVALVLFKVYSQEGTVVLPFETSNVSLSGVAIADQLTAELVRIQQINSIDFDNFVLKTRNGDFTSGISTEQSLRGHEFIVPKAEIAELNIMDMGNLDIGPGTLPLGKLMIAFKNICPGSKSTNTIRGSLQRYGSNLVLVALMENKTVQGWTIRRHIDDNEKGEPIHEMIRDLAFMITSSNLKQSSTSAKTMGGLENYTEALYSYHQYLLSGDPAFLYIASNNSLDAIKSEKKYRMPYDLLSRLESEFIGFGKQLDAIEYCNKTIDLDPNSTYAWFNKGQVLCALLMYNDSIKAFDNATSRDRKFAPAWNGKGYSLYCLNRTEDAIKDYDEATDIDQKFVDAWYNKAEAYLAQGSYDYAIKAYDNATDIDPKFAKAWNDKGYTLNRLNRPEKAIEAYDMAVELDPKSATFWRNRGYTLSKLNRTLEANTAFAEAEELG